MTQRFKVADYWPWPKVGENVTNIFDNNFVNVYTNDGKGGTVLHEYKEDKWQDNWYLRNDPLRGVLEYKDDILKTRWTEKLIFWSPFITNSYVEGKEIVWGVEQTRGDTIEGQCQMNGWFGSYGWQKVTFDEILPTFSVPGGTFSDVLVLRYWQTWGSSPLVYGAKMWMAKGRGQIKAAWVQKDGTYDGPSITLAKAQLTLKFAIPVSGMMKVI